AATVRQVKQSASDSRDYTDQQITTLRDNNNEKFAALNGEISDVRKEARAGIASAMAAAGLRYDDRAGKGSIAMGMGGFKNATSIAAGVGY
ncbi:BrpC, partial [Ochrobactrum sp. SFR4]|nr:BrpC [Ochrobactrum sp. SFR4]